MEAIAIARTAGGKLARRSAHAIQDALVARGFAAEGHEVRKAITRDFAEDFEVALARVRARGVDAVEVPMSVLEARSEAIRELAALNA